MRASFWRPLLCAVLGFSGPLAALEIEFDYSYDGTGFFADQTRRQVLEAAGAAWESKLVGVETPAIPLGTGGNTWTLKFNRPDTVADFGANNTSLVNKPLPANKIVIYVGARPNVYGGFLGYAEYAWTVSGSSTWVNAIAVRNTGTRFASFGGAVAFDSDVAWHFDTDTATKEDFVGQYDFYTIAMHEIGHLLGFNTGSAAFNRLSLGGQFSGQRTVALFGSQPQMGTGGHWADGMTFQDAGLVMRPLTPRNQRVEINPLEVTLLQDLGYVGVGRVQVVLGPAAALSAGARWRLDGGVERDSGAVVSNVSVGQRSLSFKSLPGFFPVADQTVNVIAGQTTVVNVDYVPVPTPVVTQAPLSSLVELGSAVTLSVAASGGGADLSYVWKKGTTLLGNVKTADYGLPAVTLAQAGAYSVDVKSAGGVVGPLRAHLGVLGAVSTPDIVNETTTLTVRLAVAGPGLLFQWFRDGQVINDDQGLGISGATQSTLTVRRVGLSAAGQYTCRVRIPDAAGGPVVERFSGAKTVAVRLRPVVNDGVLGPWKVSGSVTEAFTAQNGPLQFRVTGLPTGVVLNKVTGQLSGKPLAPRTYRLGVSASNLAGEGPVRFFEVVCQDLEPRAKGTFVGLMQRTAVNGELGGSIGFTVSPSGVISGKLSMANETRTFRSAWESLPGTPLTSSFEIRRSTGQPSWQVVLNLTAADGKVTGTLTEGLQPPTVIEAWQSDWQATSQPATNYQGVYTAALLPEPALQVLQLVALPQLPTPEPQVPEGAGYAMLRVTTAGAVTWTGRLADGTALTRSLRLGREGDIPLHAMLFKGTGSMQGWVKIQPDLPALAASQVNGDLTWSKRDQGVTQSGNYRSGFPLHTVTVLGGTYRSTDSVPVQLALAAPPQNARLAFAGGGLATAVQAADVGIPLGIALDNKIQEPALLENPTRTRLSSLSVRTGLFSGSFTLRDPQPGGLVGNWDRTVTFHGLLVPRLRQGVGAFLLEQLVLDRPVPIKSGLVVLEANP
jgi:hypothetical protein